MSGCELAGVLAVAGVTVVTVDCDLTSFAAVRAAIAPLRAACGGKLDVLMLNAGIMATPDEVVQVDPALCM